MADTIRCFFALWPDDEVRGQLAQLGKDYLPKQARPMRPDNLHITLAFLGNIPPGSLDCFDKAASGISFSPFELIINELGYFPRPRVFWAGATETPEVLKTLYQDLNDAVQACGFEPDNRPFVPHVTLARHCPFVRPPALATTITWPVNRFVLVQSHTYPEGVEYEVIREFYA